MLTKTNRAMYRLTTSMANWTMLLACSTKARTVAVFSPSTSSTSPVQMARQMICRELPSVKGVSRLPGMIPSSIS